ISGTNAILTGTTVANNIIQMGAVFDTPPAGGTFTNNKINTNPLFVNTATFDYHLQTGSPAIDAGLTLTMVSNDFEGHSRPQGPAFDIGAYEVPVAGSNKITPASQDSAGKQTNTAVRRP